MSQSLCLEPAGAHAFVPRSSGIEAARSKYLDMIIERILLFEAYAADLRAEKRETAALDGISALSHKISGVSETLGFPRIGDIASDLEVLIENGRAANSAPSKIWTKAEPVMEDLLVSLEALLES